MTRRDGIDFLRWAVGVLGDCRENFNQRFNVEELVTIARCFEACEWDIYPDQWEPRQVKEALFWGRVPEWDSDEKPYYHEEQRSIL